MRRPRASAGPSASRGVRVYHADADRSPGVSSHLLAGSGRRVRRPAGILSPRGAVAMVGRGLKGAAALVGHAHDAHRGVDGDGEVGDGPVRAAVRPVRALPGAALRAGRLACRVRPSGRVPGRAGLGAARSVGRAGGRGARAGARAASSGVRGMARGVVSAGRMAIRVASRARAAVAAMASALTVSPAVVAVLCALLVVVMLVSLFMPAASNAACGYGSVRVPDRAEPWVRRAARSSGLDAALIAAIMSQESGFRPDAHADGPDGGTWGLLQMSRGVWRGVHPEGAELTPPSGITDPMAHATYGGLYLKRRLQGVRDLKARHPDAAFASLGDTDALVIAHNAGEGSLLRYPDIPGSTRAYLENIHRMAGGAGCTVDGGSTVGELRPPLVMNADGYHVNVSATGTDENSMPSYARFQCTWWAAIRRKQIGRPVDAHMGNGAQWRDSAARLGYALGPSPRPGDVICFQGGVHGSSAVYGHVAVVEQVKSDGSVVISQSGTGWMAVVIETISANQLASMGSGISFIH